MKLKPGQVLVEADDHRYRAVNVAVMKVVWCPKAREYFEYHGDEYLEPGEVVVTASVAG